MVSTHSRPKAAGQVYLSCAYLHTCFNTQPPEGGWDQGLLCLSCIIVSTHSRPKAAGRDTLRQDTHRHVSTHSRPKAAGFLMYRKCDLVDVSTHSRPKAAGLYIYRQFAFQMFQHTAARRRLGAPTCIALLHRPVSTHSRPKAAGAFSVFAVILSPCFNTQPPEGGWFTDDRVFHTSCGFQHTAARRRLGHADANGIPRVWFQHTAARRRLVPLFFRRPTNSGFNTQPPEGGWRLRQPLI